MIYCEVPSVHSYLKVMSADVPFLFCFFSKKLLTNSPALPSFCHE